MQQLSVSELMRECSSVIVSDRTLLRDAAEILLNQASPVLIAKDESGQIAGIVAESSVIRMLLTSCSATTTVAAILSRHVETVRAETEVRTILHLFRAACHSVIPVVDDSTALVGLLHRQDIVRILLSDGSWENGRAGLPSRQKPHFLDRSRNTAGPDNDEHTSGKDS